jgi:hypothetical protein
MLNDESRIILLSNAYLSPGYVIYIVFSFNDSAWQQGNKQTYRRADEGIQAMRISCWRKP